MGDPIKNALELASHQCGVLTLTQLRSLGVGRAVRRGLLGRGQWQRLAPGLFLSHSSELSPEGAAWAGVLLGGPESIVAGRAAAHLLGFSPMPALVTVAVPHNKQVRPVGRWQFERRREMPTARGEPPRTNVEDTVLDLCDANPDEAEHWVMEACRLHLTTRARLTRALRQRSRLRGRRDLMDLLTPDQEGIESPLERRYHRDVVQLHGLPKPTRQVRHGPHRYDMLHDKFDVVVELDGRRGHDGAGVFRDMTRDNRNTACGRLTLRYGWVDCTQHPCTVAVQVGHTLQLRGWAGEPHTCNRCRIAA